MTLAEKQNYLGAMNPSHQSRAFLAKLTTLKAQTTTPKAQSTTYTPQSLPASVDWRNVSGCLQPIKNQGHCGLDFSRKRIRAKKFHFINLCFKKKFMLGICLYWSS